MCGQPDLRKNIMFKILRDFIVYNSLNLNYIKY